MITENEIKNQLNELAKYNVFERSKKGFLVSDKYRKAWKSSLEELAKNPKDINSVADANVSAHLKALWICGWFDKARSEPEIARAVTLVDSFRNR